MFRRRTWLLTLTLASTSPADALRAQSPAAAQDSIMALLRSADTLAARGQPDSSLAWCRAAAALAGASRHFSAEASAHSCAARAFGLLGRPDSAVPHHQEAILITRRHRYRRGEATELRNLGLTYLYELRRPDSALRYYREALLAARRLRDVPGQARAHQGIGATQRALGRFAAALASNRSALRLFRQARDRAGEGDALTQLAEAHADARHGDSAVIYYRRAGQVRSQEGNRLAMAGLLLRTGSAQLCLAEPADSAALSYRAALTLFDGVGALGGAMHALSGLGKTWIAMGRADSALATYRRLLEVAREAGDSAGMTEPTTRIGELEAIGERPLKRLPLAERAADPALCPAR